MFPMDEAVRALGAYGISTYYYSIIIVGALVGYKCGHDLRDAGDANRFISLILEDVGSAEWIKNYRRCCNQLGWLGSRFLCLRHKNSFRKICRFIRVHTRIGSGKKYTCYKCDSGKYHKYFKILHVDRLVLFLILCEMHHIQAILCMR